MLLQKAKPHIHEALERQRAEIKSLFRARKTHMNKQKGNNDKVLYSAEKNLSNFITILGIGFLGEYT